MPRVYPMPTALTPGGIQLIVGEPTQRVVWAWAAMS
jgi:hypothetical protein